MIEKKIGIFTLAITLILLGVLFLINNLMNIDIRFILSVFWPSIIILLGIEIFLSKIIFQKDETKDKVPISGKSIFFILVIVFVVFVLSELQSFPFYINTDVGIIPVSYKSQTTVNKEVAIEAKDKKKLKIKNSFGDINLDKNEEKDIKVNMLVKMKHNYDEEEARKIADNILKVTNDSRDYIELISQRDKYISDNKLKDLEIDLEITVPYDMELDIVNEHGDIEIYDFANSAKVSNRHGDILVQDTEGILEIKNSHGAVEVYNLDGEANIENRHGRISAQKITKYINIVSQHGDIQVIGVDGNVDIDNSHDSIEVKKIGGNLIIESRYCGVDIEDVSGDIKVKGSHGSIDAKNIEGNVRIDNEQGVIGLVNANNAVELNNRNDKIFFESDKAISKWLKVDNAHGRVNIRLPKSQEGKFNIYTRHGQIRNDFGLNIDSNQNEESIDESIGNKDVTIDIRAEHGDISIDAAME